MSGNTIGKLFTLTTFGESHGPSLGCIIDGCPPGLFISEKDIQFDLDRRKPGKSRYTTQRMEGDQIKILSGIFDGKTTGTPIGLLIEEGGGHRPEKQRCELPQVLSQKNTYLKIKVY